MNLPVPLLPWPHRLLCVSLLSLRGHGRRRSYVSLNICRGWGYNGPVCAEHGQKHSVTRNFLIKFFSLSLHPCTWISTHTTVEQGSQEENHSNQWDMRKLYLHSHRVILYILFVCCCFLILRAFMSVHN